MTTICPKCLGDTVHYKAGYDNESCCGWLKFYPCNWCGYALSDEDIKEFLAKLKEEISLVR